MIYHLKSIDYGYVWNQEQVPVLKKLDIDLEEGCFTCLCGPSGTGKTTLLNLLGLLDMPASGQLQFLGQDLGPMTERQLENLRLTKIGFIFQSFYLIPTLSVLENTSYFLPSLGMTSEQARKRSLDVLDLLGLSDHALKKPSQLSGGQRQRVAIARALAKKPKVILADEPTANLDGETASRIIEAFLQLQRTEKTSFIFSTHDQHLMSYSKDCRWMENGKLASTARAQ
jgi:ABC-type lipoprotein export system ATPase subunit